MFLYICLAYSGFQPDNMIHCRYLTSEAALVNGNEVVGFNEKKLTFC